MLPMFVNKIFVHKTDKIIRIEVITNTVLYQLQRKTYTRRMKGNINDLFLLNKKNQESKQIVYFTNHARLSLSLIFQIYIKKHPEKRGFVVYTRRDF